MDAARPLPSRNTLLEWLADASISGYLGLFVGTGFSKAAAGARALGFEELLARLAIRFDLEQDFVNSPRYRTTSLPQIASLLLEEYVAAKPPRARAEERFRDEIAQLCNLVPDAAASQRLAPALGGARPAWVITTNYDLILEALMEQAESILTTQPLVARPDRVPIYHLHGHRHIPASIKITEEDYVGLLGPIDYQRLKLPLLLLESTTLMLGYALGDINVRVAMEWSRSLRGERGLKLQAPQGEVVQALYKTSPKSQTYLGPNGETVLEISDVTDFLEELSESRAQRVQELQLRQTAIENFLAEPANAPAVHTDPSKRKVFLDLVHKALPSMQPTRMIDFLSRALDPVWNQARGDSQFTYYNVYLELVLNILERIDHRRANPAIVSYLGDALDRVGWYIDPKEHLGSAWDASRTWLAKHTLIRDGMKRELQSYAAAYDKFGLAKMLELVEE